MNTQLLQHIKWNNDGLIAAIAQDCNSGRVLMMAWMNAESLQLSIDSGDAVYWSRSRGKLWRKGESSGNVQKIRSMALDCDGDTLLIQVEQLGGIACHTGRQSCFYRTLSEGDWKITEKVLKDPATMYQHVEKA
ncbi:Phosphoribosyl-AMP cyclohydrolase [Zhongshania aliphaticivorans]|uniref:Phosphoribosyl-AMP cyclohydrolase n=1 Tax=Zhongshania aliphaticivorans TaxID=1470434 RepID=A0A5S9N386_9GAMM|nr:phosphoribosyl-AMP cyclohydrolase [Zhongshania aliphaticivorans]CAA0082565.1 Phosphoribosyl-AMP cyclohydrolase [Zhongshania aliphaticivorans]CAA0084188.1 Phosphoribosyl-AMP cyclohydrolase [Zhongshania aliphaticivorans]